MRLTLFMTCDMVRVPKERKAIFKFHISFIKCKTNVIFFISDEIKMASHVLQIFFLGDTGFRFPIAHVPCTECVASEIYVIFWDVVRELMKNGFDVSTRRK